VELKFGSRTFAPSLQATLLVLVGIVAVSHLGVWQLQRGAEKQALLDQIDAGEATTHTLTADASGLQRYQTVTATGHYDSAHQVLLDNMPSIQGLPGYRVLTPFELSTGGWVVVDRGWLPIGASRSVLPSIDVGGAERTIIGRLDEVPRPGMRLGKAPDSTTWPRVMNYPEHADLERVLARPLGTRIVRLDPKQPDGYERSFEMRPDFGPNRHIAYAVQWFAIAVAMLVIYVFVNLKRNA